MFFRRHGMISFMTSLFGGSDWKWMTKSGYVLQLHTLERANSPQFFTGVSITVFLATSFVDRHLTQFFSSTFGEFHFNGNHFRVPPMAMEPPISLQRRNRRRLRCADLGVVPARASPNVCGAACTKSCEMGDGWDRNGG